MISQTMCTQFQYATSSGPDRVQIADVHCPAPDVSDIVFKDRKGQEIKGYLCVPSMKYSRNRTIYRMPRLILEGERGLVGIDCELLQPSVSHITRQSIEPTRKEEPLHSQKGLIARASDIFHRAKEEKKFLRIGGYISLGSRRVMISLLVLKTSKESAVFDTIACRIPETQDNAVAWSEEDVIAEVLQRTRRCNVPQEKRLLDVMKAHTVEGKKVLIIQKSKDEREVLVMPTRFGKEQRVNYGGLNGIYQQRIYKSAGSELITIRAALDKCSRTFAGNHSLVARNPKEYERLSANQWIAMTTGLKYRTFSGKEKFLEIMSSFQGGDLVNALRSQAAYFAKFKNKMDVMRQMLQAVAGIQADSFLHRDIKLENFLVRIDDKGRLVIALSDPDLICATDAQGRCKMKGLSGTIPYVPPEDVHQHLIAQQREIDTGIKADSWALGLTLYQLLTGTFPSYLDEWERRGRREIKTLNQVFQERHVQWLHERRTHVAATFLIDQKSRAELAILMLLEWNPTHRATAQQVLNLMTMMPI